MKYLNFNIILVINILLIILIAIIFLILSNRAFNFIKKIISLVEDNLKAKTSSEIIIGSLGLIIGLLIAFLISPTLNNIPYIGVVLSIALYIICAYLGIRIAEFNRDDIFGKAKEFFVLKKLNKEKSKILKIESPKILDTSVIIDGRIKEISKTGFIEGTIIIPTFVLKELQHIADSSDGLKRNRGRRGLDIIKDIQNEKNINIEIIDRDYEKLNEVDSKLVQLAKDLNGKILTNDYNLNKVASVQDVVVLNINQLANSVKTVYLPGEDITIQIVKEGKESGQGLGYFDDGTMIVVENGKKFLGKSINVTVTSVFQTDAGKMIFASIKK